MGLGSFGEMGGGELGLISVSVEDNEEKDGNLGI